MDQKEQALYQITALAQFKNAKTETTFIQDEQKKNNQSRTYFGSVIFLNILHAAYSFAFLQDQSSIAITENITILISLVFSLLSLVVIKQEGSLLKTIFSRVAALHFYSILLTSYEGKISGIIIMIHFSVMNITCLSTWKEHILTNIFSINLVLGSNYLLSKAKFLEIFQKNGFSFALAAIETQIVAIFFSILFEKKLREMWVKNELTQRKMTVVENLQNEIPVPIVIANNDLKILYSNKSTNSFLTDVKSTSTIQKQNSHESLDESDSFSEIVNNNLVPLFTSVGMKSESKAVLDSISKKFLEDREREIGASLNTINEQEGKPKEFEIQFEPDRLFILIVTQIQYQNEQCFMIAISKKFIIEQKETVTVEKIVINQKIVQKIVEKIVYLPAQPKEESQQNQASAGPSGASALPQCGEIRKDKIQLLMIDDNSMMMMNFQAIKLKYTPVPEKNFMAKGDQALEQIREMLNQNLIYHVILIDLDMPGMNGFEVARAIRKLEAQRNSIPTYLVGMNSPDSEQSQVQNIKKDCTDSGMDDLITKPFKAAILETIIDRVLMIND